MESVRVGLLGLGTVGCGVWKTIKKQEKKLRDRLNKKVEIVKVVVKDVQKERPLYLPKDMLTTNFEDLYEENLDVLVEVMGGIYPAYDYIKEAFQRGWHVVTANKELLAKHGQELVRLANQHQVHFYYEGSVAGGIPILHVLRQVLRTNDIYKLEGIVNGTTNYILPESVMCCY